MNICGCNKVVNQQFETEIPSCSLLTNVEFPSEYTNCRDFYELKNKVISEFKNVLKNLKCGVQPDLELILLEISLIYIYDE